MIVVSAEATGQGPVPSGSGRFHLRRDIVPTSESAGVYIAFAAFLSGINIPKPPVQKPPLTAFAPKVTAVCPQTIKSGPAFAMLGVLDVIVIASDKAVHGPLPSGSGIFHVRVIVVPISVMAGVYIA